MQRLFILPIGNKDLRRTSYSDGFCGRQAHGPARELRQPGVQDEPAGQQADAKSLVQQTGRSLEQVWWAKAEPQRAAEGPKQQEPRLPDQGEQVQEEVVLVLFVRIVKEVGPAASPFSSSSSSSSLPPPPPSTRGSSNVAPTSASSTGGHPP